jgi:hypothetical protein
VVTLIELAGHDVAAELEHTIQDQGEHGLDVRVDWPDGVRTRTRLDIPVPGQAVPAAW